MSFQATEWARGLPLHSLSAKFTLMMIGSYAGTDGTCFPSLSQLAEDTLQSVATVRRRERELEQLGLLVRFARWRSPDGKVVLTQLGDANRPLDCRQTSDELRLNLTMTADQVAAKIIELGLDRKRKPDEDDTVDKSPDGGVSDCNPPRGSTAVQPSPCQSSDTPGVAELCHPLNRNLKSSPETPPCIPPSGGVVEGQEQRRVGEQRLSVAEPMWPDPITDANRAIVVLGVLSETEWADCRTGIKGYTAFIQKNRDAGHDRIVKDFHNWVRNRQWVGFITSGTAAQKAKQRTSVAIDSAEGLAWRALHQIARINPIESHATYLLVPGSPSPQLMALANAPSKESWSFIDESQINQIAAWRQFIVSEIGDRVRPELVSDRNWQGSRRIWRRGFLAPWRWPPKKDGSISVGPSASP